MQSMQHVWEMLAFCLVLDPYILDPYTRSCIRHTPLNVGANCSELDLKVMLFVLQVCTFFAQSCIFLLQLRVVFAKLRRLCAHLRSRGSSARTKVVHEHEYTFPTVDICWFSRYRRSDASRVSTLWNLFILPSTSGSAWPPSTSSCECPVFPPPSSSPACSNSLRRASTSI